MKMTDGLDRARSTEWSSDEAALSDIPTSPLNASTSISMSRSFDHCVAFTTSRKNGSDIVKSLETLGYHLGNKAKMREHSSAWELRKTNIGTQEFKWVIT